MGDGTERAPVPRSLTRLARLHGIQTRYKDNNAEWRTAGAGPLRAILASMGVDASSPERIEEAAAARRAELDARILDPVTPLTLDPADAGEDSGGDPPPVEVRLPESALGGGLECRLRTEDGRLRAWTASAEVVDASGSDDGSSRRVRARIHLPPPLPVGYHELEVTVGDTIASTLLLAAPPTTWRPAAAEGPGPGEGARDWGVFLPLYALRSAESWGTGHFRDLERLLEWTDELGGDVVGTLPLLAGAETSAGDARVYNPVSRLFWNEAYLDLEGAPGLRESAEARRVLESAAFQERIRRLREEDLVDWKGAVEAKRAVLEPLAHDFLARGTDPIGEFLAARPEAETYARFRATWEVREEPWHRWSRQIQRAPGPKQGSRDGWERAYRYHLYAQWLADRQMTRVRSGRGERGPGLYLDLPLGSDPDGFDVWRHRELFADGISVGSPPDGFFSQGQDWGFPPLLPDAMERSGFAYTIASLRHHMRFASRLRLDHVMGLHRLFWIPSGVPATDGVYVRYPHEALYAILCIESHRHRTAVLGEDLGTVPRKVRRAMRRHRVERMFVAQFQGRPDRDPFLPPPPRRSVASVNTHDTATFAGFWKGADIEARIDLDLLEPQGARRERADRSALRSGWIRFLKEREEIAPELASTLRERAREAEAPAETGEAETPADTDSDVVSGVLRGLLRHLARSRASLVLVNLEDLWLEERPQNVPGTDEERPNFRRKARLDLEEFTSLDRVTGILEEIDALRRPGEEPEEVPSETETPTEGADMPSDASDTREAIDSSPPPGNAEAGARTDPGAGIGTSLLTDDDLHLFNEGRHFRLHHKLGSHPVERDGVTGVHFAVWAPNARSVSVIGDFNDWDPERHSLQARGSSGVWEGFLPGVERGARYKYHIRSRHGGYEVDKADPFAVRHEVPPKTASVVWDLEYEWNDEDWMADRGERIADDAPVSIYEIHPGSWMRRDGEPLSYRELAPRLVEHLEETGFTHVELLPVMEHPFYGSWGYQTTGYFAPTSRYGTPQDFMHLVDALHQAGYGVILDWVPSHFPGDEHGLAYFDGTHLFEHADPREGFHPEWKSYIFNYGRHEVRSFLVSSAIHWLERFHADGLRVDAVASMLYRDYAREDGEWIPNEHGGNENLGAIQFLRTLNEEVYRSFPDVQTMAEESTAWPMVSRPTYLGGLGFGMKWDMGWMHDTLDYLEKEPVHRSYHHDELTFRRIYAFTENFVLPLSHDEVVHGKGSLLEKMPGDGWQRFANLRLLLAYQMAQPAKKLLFMGGEFGQRREWAHDESLDWHLLEHGPHAGVQRLVGDLNRVYRNEPALHERDFQEAGFEWIDANDSAHSVLSFLRRGESPGDIVAVVFNFTPVPRDNYRVGVPRSGIWKEILNTDAEAYGGSGAGNLGRVESVPVPYHGRPHSLVLSLPPLGAVFLKAPPRSGDPPERRAPAPAEARRPGSAEAHDAGPGPSQEARREEGPDGARSTEGSGRESGGTGRSGSSRGNRGAPPSPRSSSGPPSWTGGGS